MHPILLKKTRFNHLLNQNKKMKQKTKPQLENQQKNFGRV